MIELGYPTIIALNMVDVAEKIGHRIDAGQLAEALGAAVVPMVASTGEGLRELQQKIVQTVRAGTPRTAPRAFCELPRGRSRAEIDALAETLGGTAGKPAALVQAEALLVLCDEEFAAGRPGALSGGHPPGGGGGAATAGRARGSIGAARRSRRDTARMAAIQQAVTTEAGGPEETMSDRLDRIVTHKIWGMAIFVGIMALMFLTHFQLRAIADGHVAGAVPRRREISWGGMIPPGDLQALLVKGVIQGVGAVVVFLPQICLLFLFIGLLEDTGYMARAAFLMDRLMSKVGLHGKSFIPMLSSFACAIPGIMATRTIETPKDRLVTILVAPLMSCSARLPVYTLLIAACMPGRIVRGKRDDVEHVFAGHRGGAGDGVAVQENAAEGRDADAGDGIAALQAARW